LVTPLNAQPRPRDQEPARGETLELIATFRKCEALANPGAGGIEVARFQVNQAKQAEGKYRRVSSRFAQRSCFVEDLAGL
jgi:hypothetical protein